MASITKYIDINAPADAVWDALRDFGALHQRLVPGFVTEARMVGDDVRALTFSNGARARERLVTIDDDQRRLVYTVVESALNGTHDNSSAQVFDIGDGTSRFVWIKDVLPDALEPVIDGLMTQGIGVIKSTMEAATQPA
jgi:hypothetical protein